MEVRNILLRNLPTGIQENTLRSELCKVFGTEFPAFVSPTVKVKVYVAKPNGLQCAELSGVFLSDADILKLKNNQSGIGHSKRVPRFHEAMLEERDKFGDIINKSSIIEMRERRQLSSESGKNCRFVIDKSLLREINRLYDGGNKLFINVQPTQHNKQILMKAGHFNQFYLKKENVAVIYYFTALEALQAITMFNRSNLLEGVYEVMFSNEYGDMFSGYSMMKGIGRDERVLDLQALVSVNGYIPFADIDTEIVDNKLIKDKCAVKCWRCDTYYTLEGLDINLKYIAGRCQRCNYNGEVSMSSPYIWANELFTRLVPKNHIHDLSYTQEAEELRIKFPPMKANYANATDFRFIVYPILEEEKCFSAERFHTAIYNTCKGELRAFTFVEKITLDKKKDRDLYGLYLTVSTSEFWRHNNFIEIKRILLDMSFLNKDTGTEFKQVITAVVKNLGESTYEETPLTYIFARLPLPENFVPLTGNVMVTAKYDDREYTNIRHNINNWVQDKKYESVIDHLLLRTRHDNSFTWEFKKETINKQQKSQGLDQKIVQDIREKLNNNQRLAVTRAIDNKLSLIFGPPGTGKTWTAASIIVILSIVYSGKIVVTASSNYAADNIASTILKMLRLYGLEEDVIRIYATNRQKYNKSIERNEDSENEAQEFDVLNDLVQKDVTWLKGEDMCQIKKKIYRDEEYILTVEELRKLELHIQEVELKILQGYSVVVVTSSYLSDPRTDHWQKNLKVSSLVIDEAGQMSLPSTVSIFQNFLTSTMRIILLGDPLQLRCTVLSDSAKEAGLSRSLMEWEEQKGQAPNTRIPWSNLTEQYRMHPHICQLVSNFSYKKQLTNDDTLNQRISCIPLDVYKTYPEMKEHSVIVYSHRWPEEKKSFSFSNTREAIFIANLAKTLASNGIDEHKMTCLTMYEAQRKMIQLLLEEPLSSCLKTKSVNVDGFQGKENDVIILSLVRSNQRQNTGFIKTKNRLNVALSRAKFLLIIVCDIENFKCSKNQTLSLFNSELLNVAKIVKIT